MLLMTPMTLLSRNDTKVTDTVAADNAVIAEATVLAAASIVVATDTVAGAFVVTVT